MNTKNTIQFRLGVILVLLLTIACLFVFIWQSSLYDNAVVSIRRNERVLASLGDENRNLVASTLTLRPHHDDDNDDENSKQVAKLTYKASKKALEKNFSL